VCVEKGSEFYLRKLRRDTIVLIPKKVQVKHRIRARSAQASGSLRIYQLRLKSERLLLQRVHKVERIKYIKVFERLSQGVCARVLFET
jgi:hypothetical protein